MLRRLMAVGVVVAAAAALWAAPAGASRAANAAQRKALTNAVHSSVVGGINKVPQNRYTVTGIRISTVSNSWASARLVAKPAFRSTFQNALVVAVKLAGTSRWVVVDLGSAQVGCGIAPNKVLADLFRTSRPCLRGIS